MKVANSILETIIRLNQEKGITFMLSIPPVKPGSEKYAPGGSC
ncbi:MAG: hypothetical protein U5N58_15365 [Actinomycetota bacterium]|nr:hypothetical protein [Actinomycetota bacterium]